MSDTPVPPPHGWTLTEAATALDPDGWREANFGEDAWAADPAAAEAARERHIVRFARTMEVSKHLPTRAVQVKPSGDGTLVALEDHIWSIARPRLAFDFYPPLPGGLSGIGGPRPD